MPFPVTSLLDTFTYSDGALSSVSSTWSNLGGGIASLQVTSNQLQDGGGGGAGNYYNVAGYTNSEAWVTIATLPGSGGVATIGVRIAPATLSGYDVAYTHGAPGTFEIRRFDSFVPTTLASTSLTLAAGDGIGVQMVGSTIRAYTRVSGDWTEQLSATSGTYASGNLSVSCSTTAARLDDYGGGPIRAAVPYRPPPMHLLAR